MCIITAQDAVDVLLKSDDFLMHGYKVRARAAAPPTGDPRADLAQKSARRRCGGGAMRWRLASPAGLS
jgi:hypothetical protein